MGLSLFGVGAVDGGRGVEVGRGGGDAAAVVVFVRWSAILAPRDDGGDNREDGDHRQRRVQHVQVVEVPALGAGGGDRGGGGAAREGARVRRPPRRHVHQRVVVGVAWGGHRPPRPVRGVVVVVRVVVRAASTKRVLREVRSLLVFLFHPIKTVVERSCWVTRKITKLGCLIYWPLDGARGGINSFRELIKSYINIFPIN